MFVCHSFFLCLIPLLSSSLTFSPLIFAWLTPNRNGTSSHTQTLTLTNAFTHTQKHNEHINTLTQLNIPFQTHIRTSTISLSSQKHHNTPIDTTRITQTHALKLHSHYTPIDTRITHTHTRTHITLPLDKREKGGFRYRQKANVVKSKKKRASSYSLSFSKTNKEKNQIFTKN